MEKLKHNNNNIQVSFLYTYSFWSIIIFSSVLINYLFFRGIFIKENSFLFLINSIINYSIFLSFFFLLLYKFYNYFFNKNFFISIVGIIFLFSAIIKLYTSNIKILILLDLMFFISTLAITIYILLSLILIRDIREYKRGIYIFILITLCSASLHFISVLLRNIFNFDIFSLLSYYISDYTSRVSSIFFIILFLVYMFFAAKEVLSKYTYVAAFISIFLLSLSFFLIYKYPNIFYLFITSFYNSFAVSIYFSSFIYLAFMLLFLFILITSSTTLFITKNYSYTFILFSLLIISGIDMSNFTFRFIAVFSLLELYTLERANLINN